MEPEPKAGERSLLDRDAAAIRVAVAPTDWLRTAAQAVVARVAEPRDAR
jgi:hypothetical protein